MSVSPPEPDVRPSRALHGGELPLWPVLLLSGLILYLGGSLSGGEARKAVQADRVPGAVPERALRVAAADTPTVQPLVPLGPALRGAGEDALRRAAGVESGAVEASSAVHDSVRRSREVSLRGGAALTGEGRRPLEGGSFEHGLRHGDWESRWPDGTLRSRGHYRQGRRHGLFEEYTPSGALVESLEYADGVRDGAWRAWSDAGEVVGEGTYTSGLKSGRWVLYYSDGDIREAGEYRDGLREGPWEFYDDLGRVTPRAGHYVAGIQVD